MADSEVKVLIIDNDPDIVFTIGEICEYCGYTHVDAPSGEAGYWLAQEHRPKLAVVDYHMPGWDGLLTVQKLKSLGLPMAILVLTVDERQEVAERFMEAGATDFAIKPIKAPDLMARMKVNLRIQDIQASLNERREREYLEKGMSKATLRLITDYLEAQAGPVTTEEAAAGLGLAYQTVHRYLQYMAESGLAELQPLYGQVGRPKNAYRLKPAEA